MCFVSEVVASVKIYLGIIRPLNVIFFVKKFIKNLGGRNGYSLMR